MGFACNGLCISVEPHAKQEWRESVWRGLARTAQPSGASSLGLHALELPAFAGVLTSVDRGAHDT
jgi:hypothetical protein